MRKRLEEAAVNITVNIIDRDPQPVYFAAIREAAFRGAEYGYKEAIKVAKEWLAVKGVFSGETCGDLKQYIIDFETDMNKLWEGEK